MKGRNIMGCEFSGTIGKSMTAVVRRGEAYYREWVVPKDPKTKPQLRQRGSLGKAVAAWKKLSRVDQAVWNKKAKPERRTGYNLFLSDWMRKHR